ncbi:hypothetical protein FRX31_003683, partial [Thalictrum thalictroides]
MINGSTDANLSEDADIDNLMMQKNVSERKIRFTSNLPLKELLEKIEDIIIDMGLRVRKRNGQ